MIMSDAEQENSVLGKRSRNGAEVSDEQPVKREGVEEPQVAQADAEAESDDDVGPMPMPVEGNGNGAAKKKEAQRCEVVSVSKTVHAEKEFSLQCFLMRNCIWITSRMRIDTTRVSCTEML